MILTRVIAVLAAICLVGAFALATILPPLASLAEVVASVDHPLLVWIKTTCDANLPDWMWLGVIVPLLVRPAWLIPVCMGMVLVGLAVTLGSRKKAVARSHRRRS